jgi:hypothetical protein
MHLLLRSFCRAPRDAMRCSLQRLSVLQQGELNDMSGDLLGHKLAGQNPVKIPLEAFALQTGPQRMACAQVPNLDLCRYAIRIHKQE